MAINIDEVGYWAEAYQENDSIPDRFNDDSIAATVAEAKQGTLLCFCHPKPCHGQSVLKAIAWQQRTKAIPFIIPDSTIAAQQDYCDMRDWRISTIAEALKG
jgi:hypothetical protein